MKNNMPISVKLTVVVNLQQYKLAIAKDHNVNPKDVEVIVEGYGEEQREEAPSVVDPKGGPIVGELGDAPENQTFLKRFLGERNLLMAEAAQFCGVNRSTIGRACAGIRLREESYEAIVKGLEMTPEQAKEFKKSLRQKQRDYKTNK